MSVKIERRREAAEIVIYLVKKVLVFCVSIFVLSLLVFYLSRLAPQDPLLSYYGERVEKMTVEEKEQTRERLGLNEPIYVQYGRWLGQAFQGEFGISYKYKQDVTEVIRGRMGNTLIMTGVSFFLIFAGALALGLVCVLYENRLPDRILCRIGTVTSCIPEFWLSLIFILVFCVVWKQLPSSGAYSVGGSGDVTDRIRHLVLPVMVIFVSHVWYYAYMIRNKLLGEVRQEYVRTALARGVPKRKILLKHCLKPILPAYISLMAISMPHILGGTYVVEMVFSYPGIGTLSYESARYGDYNLLMLLCLITGAVVIFCNMLAQTVNGWIDPRIRSVAK